MFVNFTKYRELILVIILVFLFTLIYAHDMTEGTFRFEDYNQGTYYKQLAIAFEKGQYGIPSDSPGADWSFYNHTNYLYFGPLPASTWLIIKNIFHIEVTFQFLSLFLSSANLLLFYFLLQQTAGFLKLNKNKTEFKLIKLIFLVIYALGSLYFLSSRNLVYETAIIFGSTLLLLSLVIFLKVYERDKINAVKKNLFLLLAGLFLTLSFFSRANLILSVFPYLLFIIYSEYKSLKQKISSALIYKTWFSISILILPILIGCLIFMHYNMARFDNPFEFGTQYVNPSIMELKTRILTNKTSSINYLLLNIVQLTAFFPRTSLTNPYVFYDAPEWLVGAYPKLVDVEFTSSVFFSSPLLLFIFYIPVYITKNKLKGKRLEFVVFIFLVMILVSIYGLSLMGYARRYYQDFYFALCILAFIGFTYFWKYYASKTTPLIKAFIIIFVCILILWTSLLAINLNCQNGFHNDLSRCFSLYNKERTFEPN